MNIAPDTFPHLHLLSKVPLDVDCTAAPSAFPRFLVLRRTSPASHFAGHLHFWPAMLLTQASLQVLVLLAALLLLLCANRVRTNKIIMTFTLFICRSCTISTPSGCAPPIAFSHESKQKAISSCTSSGSTIHVKQLTPQLLHDASHVASQLAGWSRAGFPQQRQQDYAGVCLGQLSCVEMRDSHSQENHQLESCPGVYCWQVGRQLAKPMVSCQGQEASAGCCGGQAVISVCLCFRGD